MHIERIHKMLECLAEKSSCEIEKGIENVNTEEMGEVIDMIKDLSEAEYYATITKAMNEADEADIMEKLLEYGDDRRYYDQYRMLMEDSHRRAEENEEDMMSHHIITCTRMITKIQST